VGRGFASSTELDVNALEVAEQVTGEFPRRRRFVTLECFEYPSGPLVVMGKNRFDATGCDDSAVARQQPLRAIVESLERPAKRRERIAVEYRTVAVGSRLGTAPAGPDGSGIAAPTLGVVVGSTASPTNRNPSPAKAV